MKLSTILALFNLISSAAAMKLAFWRSERQPVKLNCLGLVATPMQPYTAAELLSVSKTASAEDIRVAWMNAAKRCHSDKSGSKADDEVELCAALYCVLLF
jgi:hypothetical protein